MRARAIREGRYLMAVRPPASALGGDDWQSIETRIAPLGPQSIPLPKEVARDHERLFALKPIHPMKDLVEDQDDGAWLFDVAAIAEAVALGKITTRRAPFPTSYAAKVWGVCAAGGCVRQAEGSFLDLIWVLRMPHDRAVQPVLAIRYAAGPDLLDGSHRLTRAMLDGHKSHPSLVVSRQDVLPFRKPRA